MRGFERNLTSCWAPLPSPNSREIQAILDQTEDGSPNLINEIFHQTNLPRDHQSEQRSGLHERLNARLGFNVARLDSENISPFGGSTIPSPVLAISPGFSPSALLQSPHMVTDSSHEILPPASATGSPEMVEIFDEGNATTMVLNNELPYQPMNVDLLPQEGLDDLSTEESLHVPSYENHAAPLVPFFGSELVDATNVNIVSTEDIESNDESDEAKPPSPKRRKLVTPSMIGATRSRTGETKIFVMESDEDNPEDDFRWRKYGQKIVKRNPNPRSYYKCTNNNCKVKKTVERGADNVKLLVITFDGRHNHPAPGPRRTNIFDSKNRSGTTIPQNHINQTNIQSFGSPPLSNVTPLDKRLPTSLAPQIDMTQVYMTGLSKLPNLPTYQNPSYMYQNDEPRNGVPDGSGVYGGIIHE